MAGEMVHIEIPADDIPAAREFWGSLFGWEFNAYPGPFEYHMANVSEQQGVAITDMEPGKSGPRVYFDVNDAKASAAKVGELGGTAGEPMPVPGRGWFVTCSDRQGNEFGLWQTDDSAPETV